MPSLPLSLHTVYCPFLGAVDLDTKIPLQILWWLTVPGFDDVWKEWNQAQLRLKPNFLLALIFFWHRHNTHDQFLPSPRLGPSDNWRGSIKTCECDGQRTALLFLFLNFSQLNRSLTDICPFSLQSVFNKCFRNYGNVVRIPMKKHAGMKIEIKWRLWRGNKSAFLLGIIVVSNSLLLLW